MIKEDKTSSLFALPINGSSNACPNPLFFPTNSVGNSWHSNKLFEFSVVYTTVSFFGQSGKTSQKSRSSAYSRLGQSSKLALLSPNTRTAGKTLLAFFPALIQQMKP